MNYEVDEVWDERKVTRIFDIEGGVNRLRLHVCGEDHRAGTESDFPDRRPIGSLA